MGETAKNWEIEAGDGYCILDLCSSWGFIENTSSILMGQHVFSHQILARYGCFITPNRTSSWVLARHDRCFFPYLYDPEVSKGTA